MARSLHEYQTRWQEIKESGNLAAIVEAEDLTNETCAIFESGGTSPMDEGMLPFQDFGDAIAYYRYARLIALRTWMLEGHLAAIALHSLKKIVSAVVPSVGCSMVKIRPLFSFFRIAIVYTPLLFQTTYSAFLKRQKLKTSSGRAA